MFFPGFCSKAKKEAIETKSNQHFICNEERGMKVMLMMTMMKIIKEHRNLSP